MSLSGILNDSTFLEQGYVVFPDLLSAGAAERLVELVDSQVRPTPDSDDILIADSVRLRHGEAQKVLCDAGTPAAELLSDSSGLSVMREQMVVKKPARNLEAPWHQDSAAYNRSAKLSLFIVVNSDTPDGLEIIPGSHRGGRLPHSGKVLKDLPPETVVRAQTVTITPGSLLLLHPDTIHRGLDNRSDTTSRTYTLMLHNA